ncbi:MAG: hypothetical protein ACPGU1_11610 [Myxococcota bacterium]
MNRILPHLIGVSALLLGLVVTAGCQQTANPRVASTGLALALELRVDNEAVGEHFTDLKEQISLEKGKLKFKELRGEDLDTKTWCFMKYTIGDSYWGIVPGTDRDCTDDDDEDAKKRAKKRAKRWLKTQTQADEVRAEIDYLVTDGWYQRALKAVSQSAVSGFDFGTCVEDAIVVSADLARKQAEGRCAALMDNEELAVVELLGERGIERLGVDLAGVDDEDEEKAMKKYLGKLGELTGADGAAFLMLVNDGWGIACFEHHYLDHDETARASMLRDAVALCGDVSEKVAAGR